MATINEEKKEKLLSVTGEQIEEIVGKKAEIEKNTADIAELTTKVNNFEENVGSIDLTALQTQVGSNTSWITAHASTAATMNEEIAQNTADIADRYTKEETDSAITAKVSEIVAGAPEDFDTLKEMSDWLTEHSDTAATMNSAILANTNAITGIQAELPAKMNTADIAVLTQAEFDALTEKTAPFYFIKEGESTV